MTNDQYKPETNAVRIQTERTPQKEHATPLFLTSSFCYDDAEEMRSAFAAEREANIYSRFINPNSNEFEEKMCALEGAERAHSTTSGMSAIFASFMALLKSGDHLLSGHAVFGSTHTILDKYLPRWGVESSYFDVNKPEELSAIYGPIHG